MEIKQDVLDLAKKIENKITIDKDGNAVAEKDLFESTLEGTDLTKDSFKKHASHLELAVAATAHVFGEKAVEYFKTKGSNDKVSVDIPTVGYDRIEHVINKEVTYRNPSSGENVTKHGELRSSYRQSLKGQVKAVKEAIAEKAAKALA